MNRTGKDAGERVVPKKITSPSFFVGNEVVDVFLPLMEPETFAVYAYLKRREYTNPTLQHSVRDIASNLKRSASTVSRSLEILEHLNLGKLTRFGGSRDSECKLRDSKDAAIKLGAVYDPATLSWSLPSEAALRLEGDIRSLRQRQQGKLTPKFAKPAANSCEKQQFCVSQRNSCVSPEKRKRATRETLMGTHLLREEVRSKEVPTPTPTPTESSAEPKDKDSPDEDEPDGLLKMARAIFNGAMNDLGDHLFDTSRPPAPHLANGAGEWEKFGFGSLAVEAAAWRGEVLELVLSASDPAAAQRGLDKYHRTWNRSLREWYKCVVHVRLQEKTDKR
jgi:hypothetical protein